MDTQTVVPGLREDFAISQAVAQRVDLSMGKNNAQLIQPVSGPVLGESEGGRAATAVPGPAPWAFMNIAMKEPSFEKWFAMIKPKN